MTKNSGQLNVHVSPKLAAKFRKLARDAGIPHRELLTLALDAYAANPPAIPAKPPKPEKPYSGGKGGWGKYTPEERSAIMKARWAARKTNGQGNEGAPIRIQPEAIDAAKLDAFLNSDAFKKQAREILLRNLAGV